LSEVGESDASALLTVTAGAYADPPGAPYFLSSWSIVNRLTFSWTFPGSNGGAPVTAWNVYAANSITNLPGSTVPSYVVNDPSTFYLEVDCTNVGGFNLAQNYFYVRVAAQTSADIGQYSPISRLFCGQAPDAHSVSNYAGSPTSVTVQYAEGNLYGAELRGYKIYMNDGLGGVITLRGTVSDTSQKTYTATGLVADRDYLVQVTVVTAVGESARSATLNARSCGVPATPGAPSRLSSTATSITVQWSAPADNGCPMTGYRVYRDNNDGNADVDIYPGIGDATDPLDPSLNPTILSLPAADGVPISGNTYGYKLRAYNTRGYSESAYAQIKAASEPSQMTAPTQDNAASSKTSIALRWTVPAANGGIMKGYKVYRDSGSGTAMLASPDPTCGMEANPAPQECTISGLTVGDTYQIQMLAINEIGDGPLSIVVTMRSASMPAKITTLLNTVGSWTPTQLAYTWSAPNDNGAQIYNYEAELVRPNGVVLSWSAGGTQATPVLPATVTFANDATGAAVPTVGNSLTPGLQQGGQHKFRVAAVNAMGLGEWSDYADLATLAPKGFCLDAPTLPQNFARDASTPVAGEIMVSWTAFTTDEQNGWDDVANQRFEVWGGATTLVLLAVTTNNWYKQYVASGQPFKFKIRSKNTSGQTSVFTAILDMISGVLPSPPSTLSVTSSLPATADMTWSAVTGANMGGSSITYYEVTKDGFVTFQQVAGSFTTYTFFGLAAATQYTFEVRSRTAVGASATSTSFVATTAAR
jgi:hypothetical protein